MNTMCLFAIAGLSALLGQLMGFHDFTARPEVPFEATTFEQDALIEQASGMLGDNKEVSSVEACDALIADETLPFELRCWAVRQKMKLCAYARREWEALEAGHSWLDEHGDADYDPRAIRLNMAGIVAYRRHENFVALYEDIKGVFDELFEKHPSNDLQMMQAHLDYSTVLRKLEDIYPESRHESVAHFGKAVAVLEQIIEQDELLTQELRNRHKSRGPVPHFQGRSQPGEPTDEMLNNESVRQPFRARLQEYLNSLQAEYQHLLDLPAPTQAQTTEEEHVNQMKRRAEGVRLVRQQRIEQGISNPDEEGYSHIEVEEALRRQEQERNL